MLNNQRWRWWINKSQKINMHEYYVFIEKKNVAAAMQKEIEEITWELKRMRLQTKTFYFAWNVRTKKHWCMALLRACFVHGNASSSYYNFTFCLCCIVRAFSISIIDPIKPNKSQGCSMLVFNLLRYDLFNWPAILNANDSDLQWHHPIELIKMTSKFDLDIKMENCFCIWWIDGR